MDKQPLCGDDRGSLIPGFLRGKTEDEDQIVWIKPEDILAVTSIGEGRNGKVCIHTVDGGKYEPLDTIEKFHKLLAPYNFMRLARDNTANMNHVQEMQAYEQRVYFKKPICKDSLFVYATNTSVKHVKKALEERSS